MSNENGLILAFCDVSGWGCGQRGRCPSRFYGGTELQNLFLRCEPKKYKLFQVADLVCTLKLLEVKLQSDMGLSQCEKRFFGGHKAFKHDILRRMKAKEIILHKTHRFDILWVLLFRLCKSCSMVVSSWET